MGKLAEAYVEINSRTKAFDDGLANSEKSLAGFVSRTSSMLGAIGVGLGTAGLVRLLADATTKAGDLAETLSKVDQTFGSSKNSVLDLADSMAYQFGAVKQTTLDAASMFGLIAQGAKFSEQESARLAVTLTQLADDASSFYNTSLDVALEKIRAGLVGESEPLRAFGVMLSEDAVKAKALAMGLTTTTKELDDHAKVAARAQLIMEGLAKATGDHDRTLGSLNNQLKLFHGNWENFKVDFGNELMAMMGPELQRLNDMSREAKREGMGAAIWDYLASQFEVEPGSIADKMIGDLIKASRERKAGPFLPRSLQPQTMIPTPSGPKGPSHLGEIYGNFGVTDPTGFMSMLSPFGFLSPLGQAAFRTEPRKYDANSQKFDVASFGSDAIMRSLEGSQSPMQKLLEEQRRHGEYLRDVVDELKRGNTRQPGGRPGVYPRRSR